MLNCLAMGTEALVAGGNGSAVNMNDHRSSCLEYLLQKKYDIENLCNAFMNCSCQIPQPSIKVKNACECSRLMRKMFTKDESGQLVCKFEDERQGEELTTTSGIDTRDQGQEPSNGCTFQETTSVVTASAALYSPNSGRRVKKRSNMQSLHKLTSESDEDLNYNIKEGLLLVITDVNFHAKPAPMFSSAFDKKSVLKFFQQAGFDIEEGDDLTAEQIEQKFVYLSNDEERLKKYDCFVAVILSHGNKQGIMGTDSEVCQVEKLVSHFRSDKCKALAGKPKIFIIQACRGNEGDNGQVVIPRGESDIVPDTPHIICNPHRQQQPTFRIPTDSDILLIYATTPGRLAYGYVAVPTGPTMPNAGSWFISTLIQVFESYSSREDISSMLIRVNNILSRCEDPGMHKQISCHISMMRKKIYFIV